MNHAGAHEESMKLATFTYRGRDHVGVVDDESRRLHPIPGASDMLDLIEHQDKLNRGLAPRDGVPFRTFSSRRRSRFLGATSSASARTIASTPKSSRIPASKPAP